jgi:hypothetical protein
MTLDATGHPFHMLKSLGRFDWRDIQQMVSHMVFKSLEKKRRNHAGLEPT